MGKRDEAALAAKRLEQHEPGATHADIFDALHQVIAFKPKQKPEQSDPSSSKT